MEGGPGNPLGARAMYLYQGKRDTQIRIHGTTQPWTIGQAASNGCFRMVNEHIIDLYERVKYRRAGDCHLIQPPAFPRPVSGLDIEWFREVQGVWSCRLELTCMGVGSPHALSRLFARAGAWGAPFGTREGQEGHG